ncbi:MAG: glutamate-cysteine ligase family protein [Natronomonas sp.]
MASVHGSGSLRRSVEVEYWVIDDEGRLVEPGKLLDAAAGVEREFVEPLLEIKTTPCETTTELRVELFDRIRRVLDRADELGKGLVPTATPLNHGTIEDIPDERTQIQATLVGEDFEYVRHCAGTHIHVEQQPGRKRQQFNALVAIDPALALVNSSPHFRGREIAVGARSKLYRRMAYRDLPHQGRLWQYLDTEAEWDRRLERRYEEFETAALNCGIDRTTLASCFTPESAVWTPVKFREPFGTVEWRAPDTALPSQVVQLADDVAGIIECVGDREVRRGSETPGITDDAVVVPEFADVLEHVDSAIESGLSADVRSYLDAMGFDVDGYEPLSETLQKQDASTPEAARRLRLEWAKRLESDVRRASSVGVT